MTVNLSRQTPSPMASVPAVPLREKASKSSLSEQTSLVQRRTEWDADGEEDELKEDGKPVGGHFLMLFFSKKC